MSISVETLALAKKNTKQVVEEAVTSVYRYKGSVETLNDLPTSGQKVGDVYNVVQKAGQNYAWDGSDWDALGIAENLGDIEFTGADSEIKTINEDFWDKDKVQGELNDVSNDIANVSNDLSNTSNTLNNNINNVSNNAANAYNAANAANSQATSAYNATNALSNSTNETFANLGNVEFNDNKKEIIPYPLSGNKVFDLTKFKDTDAIVINIGDTTDLANHLSNHPEYDGALYQCPIFSDQEFGEGDLPTISISILNQYFKRIANFSYIQIPISVFKNLSSKRYLHFFGLYYKSNNTLYLDKDFYFGQESETNNNYLAYDNNSTKTISNDYYVKEEINNIIEENSMNNSLGNVSFNSSVSTVQNYDVNANKKSYAYIAGKYDGVNMKYGIGVENTIGLDMNKISKTEHNANYYYLGTVTTDNFDECITKMGSATAAYVVIGGRKQNHSDDNIHIVRYMSVPLIPDLENRRFNMIIKKDLYDNTLPNIEHFTYISFSNLLATSATNWFKMQNPVFHLQYELPVQETINNDYYDKDATNSLANDTLNAAKAYTDSKLDISMKKEVVEQLPVSNIDENTLYLVPKSNSSNDDTHDEYIYIDNSVQYNANDFNIDVSIFGQNTKLLKGIKRSEVDDETYGVSGKWLHFEFDTPSLFDNLNVGDSIMVDYGYGTSENDILYTSDATSIRKTSNNTAIAQLKSLTSNTSYGFVGLAKMVGSSPPFTFENIFDDLSKVTISYNNSSKYWEKIGSTATDLSGYYTSNEVDNIAANINSNVSNVSNTASFASNTANNALNIATAAWQVISTVTTNEATNAIVLPVDKNYEEYLITFNKPIASSGGSPIDVFSSGSNSQLLLKTNDSTITVCNKLESYSKLISQYTIKKIVDNMYTVSGCTTGANTNAHDYIEGTSETPSNLGGNSISLEVTSDTIVSGITATVYGKGEIDPWADYVKVNALDMVQNYEGNQFLGPFAFADFNPEEAEYAFIKYDCPSEFDNDSIGDTKSVVTYNTVSPRLEDGIWSEEGQGIEKVADNMVKTQTNYQISSDALYSFVGLMVYNSDSGTYVSAFEDLSKVTVMYKPTTNN